MNTADDETWVADIAPSLQVQKNNRATIKLHANMYNIAKTNTATFQMLRTKNKRNAHNESIIIILILIILCK